MAGRIPDTDCQNRFKGAYLCARVTITDYGIFDKNFLEILGKETEEWLILEGTSGGHLDQPPTQAGSSRSGCPGPCTDSS